MVPSGFKIGPSSRITMCSTGIELKKSYRNNSAPVKSRSVQSLSESRRLLLRHQLRLTQHRNNCLILQVRRVAILAERAPDHTPQVSFHGFLERPVDCGVATHGAYEFGGQHFELIVAHDFDGTVVCRQRVVEGEFVFCKAEFSPRVSGFWLSAEGKGIVSRQNGVDRPLLTTAKSCEIALYAVQNCCVPPIVVQVLPSAVSQTRSGACPCATTPHRVNPVQPRIVQRVSAYFRSESAAGGKSAPYRPATYWLRHHAEFWDEIDEAAMERVGSLFERVNSLLPLNGGPAITTGLETARVLASTS